MAIVLLAAGLGLAIAGAEAFLDGLLAAAARLGVSAFAITVAISGFEPENLAAGIAANAKGLPGAAAGTFLGGTTFLALGVSGLAAVIAPIRATLPTAALAWTAAAAPVPVVALGLVELQARGVLEVPVDIHHDERRHIGYGVLFLRKRCRDRPDAGHRFVSARPWRVFAAEGESKRRFPGGDAAVFIPMDASEFIKAQLPPPPARVLDVGCGDGRLVRELNDLGYRVIAIDPRAPAGPFFRRVSLEEFEDAERFDAAVARGTLHHIADLGNALPKLRNLLVQGGLLIVVEHAWDRLDEATAGWYLEKRRAVDPSAPKSVQACLSEWEDDHAGLHDSATLRHGLERCFAERFFAWSPYLHGELGEAVEDEERRLIEAGQIQAMGFLYVGAVG